MRFHRTRRLIRWGDRQTRIWWPALAALVAGAILGTLGWVVGTIIEGRDNDRERNRQLEALVEQQAQIIERDRHRDANAEARLQAAIDQVEAVMTRLIDDHHEDQARKINDVVAQLAHLLDRPVPPPIVVERQTAPTPRLDPGPTAPPTPVTTTPDQRRCAENPDHPRC